MSLGEHRADIRDEGSPYSHVQEINTVFKCLVLDIASLI